MSCIYNTPALSSNENFLENSHLNIYDNLETVTWYDRENYEPKEMDSTMATGDAGVVTMSDNTCFNEDALFDLDILHSTIESVFSPVFALPRNSSSPQSAKEDPITTSLVQNFNQITLASAANRDLNSRSTSSKKHNKLDKMFGPITTTTSSTGTIPHYRIAPQVYKEQNLKRGSLILPFGDSNTLVIDLEDDENKENVSARSNVGKNKENKPKRDRWTGELRENQQKPKIKPDLTQYKAKQRMQNQGCYFPFSDIKPVSQLKELPAAFRNAGDGYIHLAPGPSHSRESYPPVHEQTRSRASAINAGRHKSAFCHVGNHQQVNYPPSGSGHVSRSQNKQIITDEDNVFGKSQRKGSGPKANGNGKAAGKGVKATGYMKVVGSCSPSPPDFKVDRAHPKYKTEKCVNFPMGNCKFGDNCAFIHE